MARTKFHCQILTPEGQVFDDEIEMLSTRTSEGSIGILANHAPLMGMLEPTELRVYKSESDVVRLAQSEGYLQVYENEALVLIEEALPPDQLDRSRIEERLRECEQALEQAEEGSEDERRHRRDVRRHRAFLEIASS